MKKLALLSLLLLICLVGCEEKSSVPEAPPPPPPPPPPTAEALHKEAKANLSDLFVPGAQTTSQQVRQRINDTKAKLRAEVNGEKALRMITADVRDALKLVKEAADAMGSQQRSLWDQVLVLADAMEALDPNYSMLDHIRQQAIEQKNRPMVSIGGFFTDENTGEVTVFAHVFLPKTNETKRLHIREGDEFENLRFVEIIGNQRGIKLQYVPTGEFFEVMK